jgi:predicted metal-dependent phosphoesterase TrpH
MYDVDLHAHTRFFHHLPGRPTAYDPVGAELLAMVSRRRGMDGVALTNHDYRFDASTNGLEFVPGIEVSTTMGHALVVGPDPPRGTIPYRMEPVEVVEFAHDNDCAAIMAHPFRGSKLRESGADFDAVELNGKHPQTHDRVRELATELELPIVAGSDAHYPIEAARGYTRIDAEELTPEAVVDAIRDGRVEPHVEDWPTQRMIQTAYGYVHSIKHGGRGYDRPAKPIER